MSFNIEYLGASHDSFVGITAKNFPNESFDKERLQTFMNRRRPGTSDDVTERREPDIPEIEINGNEITIKIKNLDARDHDYENLKDIPRPGHADYTAYLKYGEIPIGGGQFSGRMTAPMCALGGIALQILERRGITVSAKIKSTGDIEAAKKHCDSVGGIISAEIKGLPKGLGGPFGDSLESRLSARLFEIPAVKGIEFGDGFKLAEMVGSKANDQYKLVNGEIVTETNHCGGILGGISNGMPVTLNVAIKPTPSIGLEQNSVNLKTMEETKIVINGRHDPCIVPRAVPVVEAMIAITILEILEEDK